MGQPLLVLGGGAAGVAAAYEAAVAGFDVDLIEQSDRLGGLHRSVRVNGAVFDTGAFLFDEAHPLVHTFPHVRDAFISAAVKPVRISPQGSYDHFPLSVRGYVRDNGIIQSMRDAADLARWRLRKRPIVSVPDFVASYTGRRVYQRSGLSTYIQRLYGLKDDEVALEFAAQRLIELRDYTMTAMIRGWVRQYLPAHNVTLLRHPDGFGVVYNAIGHELQRLGVRIETAVTPIRLTRADGGFILETTGWQREYAQVVSTIPIRAALRLLGLPQDGEYQYMYLHSLFLCGNIIPAGNIFYNFTPRAAWKRATVFSRLYGLPPHEDHFTVEVTSHFAEGTEALGKEFIQHATALGFAKQLRVVGSVVTADAYPVYRRGRSKGRDVDRRRLRDAGIHIAGRQGRFEYLSAAAAMKQAKAIVARSPD